MLLPGHLVSFQYLDSEARGTGSVSRDYVYKTNGEGMHSPHLSVPVGKVFGDGVIHVFETAVFIWGREERRQSPFPRCSSLLRPFMTPFDRWVSWRSYTGDALHGHRTDYCACPRCSNHSVIRFL